MASLSIKNLRLQAGKTIKDMAALCDRDARTYAKWENDPDSIPHGLWLQIIEYLETTIRINTKEHTMGQHMGKAKVEFISNEEAAKEDRLEDYTVPIPEGLTEDFEPSQPVTPKQMLAYDRTGKEPYPGYAREMQEWEDAWEMVNRAQLIADGANPVILDLPERHPDYNADGNLTPFDETTVIDDGDGDVAVIENRPDPNDPASLPTDEDFAREEANAYDGEDD